MEQDREALVNYTGFKDLFYGLEEDLHIPDKDFVFNTPLMEDSLDLSLPSLSTRQTIGSYT